CERAGMQGFVAKPVEPDALFSTVIKWLRKPGDPVGRASEVKAPKEAAAAAQSRQNEDQQGPVDPQALALVFENDQESQRDILQKFMNQADSILVEVEAAHGRRDCEQIRFQSHKLKSSARTVGAGHLADLSLALELAAGESDWNGIDDQVAGMRPAIEAIRDYVKRF
ncbi:MAG: Hpt domain-containing protein, partial [Gammaproteobacteria bacterium]|nr:Hpt domain-containing protein [Gammaproteobacteria bacterium]